MRRARLHAMSVRALLHDRITAPCVLDGPINHAGWPRRAPLLSLTTALRFTLALAADDSVPDLGSAPTFGQHPLAFDERWSMANVLAMTARQLGNPVLLLILLESDDGALLTHLQCSSSTARGHVKRPAWRDRAAAWVSWQ